MVRAVGMDGSRKERADGRLSMERPISEGVGMKAGARAAGVGELGSGDVVGSGEVVGSCGVVGEVSGPAESPSGIGRSGDVDVDVDCCCASNLSPPPPPPRSSAFVAALLYAEDKLRLLLLLLVEMLLVLRCNRRFGG